MNKFIAIFLILSLTGFHMTGCATTKAKNGTDKKIDTNGEKVANGTNGIIKNSNSNGNGNGNGRNGYGNGRLATEQKQALRALAGGVLGVLVQGTTLGAIAGAFCGDIVNLFVTPEAKPRIEPEEEAKSNGDRVAKLFIEELQVDPQSAKNGSKVAANVRYTLYPNVPSKQIVITEKMTLKNDKEEVELVKRDIQRTQGEYTFTIQFTVPEGISKGDYTVLTTISTGDYSKKARSIIKII
ncbi:MAG: hypothetical protein FJ240_11825 [Nitrospira sp.]|nr:hypothetical protein [Nitrospira sp.]